MLAVTPFSNKNRFILEICAKSRHPELGRIEGFVESASRDAEESNSSRSSAQILLVSPHLETNDARRKGMHGRRGRSDLGTQPTRRVVAASASSSHRRMLRHHIGRRIRTIHHFRQFGVRVQVRIGWLPIGDASVNSVRLTSSLI